MLHMYIFSSLLSCTRFENLLVSSSIMFGSSQSSTVMRAATNAVGERGTASTSSPRVAVIGAGAAGLVTARHLLEKGFYVTIYEKSNNVGGLWKYTDELKEGSVMYKSLRTNLPKEIMELRDHGFNPAYPSFVTHEQVASYLETYANRFHLNRLIRFKEAVQSVIPRGNSSNKLELPPLLTPQESRHHCHTLLGHSMSRDEIARSRLEDHTEVRNRWEQVSNDSPDPENWEVTSVSKDGKEVKESFDFVAVCNGHYANPECPILENQEHFKGRVLHSAEYRTPDSFRDCNIIVVGAGPSGTDIGLELASVGNNVYLATRECSAGEEKRSLHTGETQQLLSVSSPIKVDQTSGMLLTYNGNLLTVDTILWCTGYSYQFPFLKCADAANYHEQRTENAETILLINQDKRVHPLYLQLFHAIYPSLAFVGISWRVNPFPFFECQADLISQVWTGTRVLPNAYDRLLDLRNGYDYYTGPFALPLRYTHMLGPLQWQHCRQILRKAGHIVPDEVALPTDSKHITLNESKLPTEVDNRYYMDEHPWTLDDTVRHEHFLPNHSLSPGEKVLIDHDIYLHTARGRQYDPVGYRTMNFAFHNKHHTPVSSGDDRGKYAAEYHPGWIKTYPKNLTTFQKVPNVKDI